MALITRATLFASSGGVVFKTSDARQSAGKSRPSEANIFPRVLTPRWKILCAKAFVRNRLSGRVQTATQSLSLPPPSSSSPLSLSFSFSLLAYAPLVLQRSPVTKRARETRRRGTRLDVRFFRLRVTRGKREKLYLRRWCCRENTGFGIASRFDPSNARRGNSSRGLALLQYAFSKRHRRYARSNVVASR